METINKNSMVATIAEKLGVAKKSVSELIDTIEDVVKTNILEGKKVKLGSLGTFYKQERKERNGVNPRSKERIVIPAQNGLGFKPSTTTKTFLNE